MRGAVVLIAALLLIPASARANFAVPIDPEFDLLVPAGDGAVLDQAAGLTFASAAGTKRIAPLNFWIGVDASATRVAALSGDLGSDLHTGKDFTYQATAWLGAPGERLRPVMRCGKSRGLAPEPVVSGDAAAWRGCSGTTVVVHDGDRARALAAGGIVAALTVRDRTLTWVALRAAGSTRVRSLDLDTGVVREVGRIKRYSPDAELFVDTGADGRVAVSSYHAVDTGSCRVYLATAGQPFRLLATDDCAAGALDRAPERTTVTGGRHGTLPRLVLTNPDGTTRVLAHAYVGRTVESATGAIFVRYGCSRASLVGVDFADPGPPITGTHCPVEAVRTTASAQGIDVTARCPHGCRVSYPELRVSGRRRATSPRFHAHRPPGATFTVHFDVPRRTVADLERGASASVGFQTLVGLRRAPIAIAIAP